MKTRIGLTGGLLVMLATLLLPGQAPAQALLTDVQVVDVTPAGFAVIGRTSTPTWPTIRVYADAAGAEEVTTQLEVTPFPLWGGDPTVTAEYDQDAIKRGLQGRMQALGILKLQVHGCIPETAYYFQLLAEDTEETLTVWPETFLAEVVTARENTFVAESRQVLVSLSDTAGSLDPQGWLVTAASGSSPYPISAVVADGADTREAFLNLARLFAPDGSNWQPGGVQALDLSIYGPSPQGAVTRRLSVEFGGSFRVAAVSSYSVNVDLSGDPDPGDLDGNGISLGDAVLALQIMAGLHPVAPVFIAADVDADSRIGMAEVLFILQDLAGLRP